MSKCERVVCLLSFWLHTFHSNFRATPFQNWLFVSVRFPFPAELLKDPSGTHHQQGDSEKICICRETILKNKSDGPVFRICLVLCLVAKLLPMFCLYAEKLHWKSIFSVCVAVGSDAVNDSNVHNVLQQRCRFFFLPVHTWVAFCGKQANRSDFEGASIWRHSLQCSHHAAFVWTCA